MKRTIVVLVILALLLTVAGCATPIRAMGSDSYTPDILLGPYEAPQLLPVQPPQISARPDVLLGPYEAPQRILKSRPQILLDPYE
jgi:hypothetical protein